MINTATWNQWDDIHSTSEQLKRQKRLVKKGFLRLKLMNLIVMLFSKGQAVNTQPRSLIVLAEILP